MDEKLRHAAAVLRTNVLDNDLPMMPFQHALILLKQLLLHPLCSFSEQP